MLKSFSLIAAIARAIRSNSTSGLLEVTGPAAGTTRVMTVPDANFTAARTDAGQTFTGTQVMTSPRIVTSINDTNGNELVGVTATASAVNEITVANAATGANPVISATGSDTNIGITLTPKGTGNAVLTSGNLVVASGAGIDFSADPHAPGMTSELLDDYEEGTWTPTYSSSGATFPYSVQTGWYRKIGNLVTVGFTLSASASGTVTNSLSISGLPFASKNAANTYGCVATGYTTFTESVTGVVGSNDTIIAMYRDNNTGNSATPTTTGMNGGAKYWIGVMQYQTD